MIGDSKRAKQIAIILGGNAVALVMACAARWAYLHTSRPERSGLYLFNLIMAGSFLGGGLISFLLEHPWREKKLWWVLLTPGILTSLFFIHVFEPDGYWSEPSFLWLSASAAFISSIIGTIAGFYLKRHHSPGVGKSPGRPLIMVLWAMMAGFLAGIIFLVIIAIPIVPMGQEGTGLIAIGMVMGVVLSGFVTGWVLCRQNLACGKRKVLMLFLCSPASVISMIIFIISTLGALFSGQIFIILQLFLSCLAIPLVSWIGALLGWGVQALASRTTPVPTVEK